MGWFKKLVSKLTPTQLRLPIQAECYQCGAVHNLRHMGTEPCYCVKCKPEEYWKKYMWWIIWVQPTEDHRPLYHPPRGEILGWWCTGYNMAGDSVLAAMVVSNTLDKAEEHVLTNWPEASKPWRFAERKQPHWLPGDRFPLSNWMKERINNVDLH